MHTFSQAIVDTIREPILILDEKLVVQSVNIPFLKTFQVTESETLGSPLFKLGNNQWDIPELRRILLEVLPFKSSFKDFEIEHTFPRIGKRFISLNARQLTLPESSRKLILLAMEDVTSRNRIKGEKQDEFDSLEVENKDLVEERALREKFVSALSHDLRNPLTAARMGTQLLLRNLNDSEKITKLAVRIMSSLDRVDSMISDLLDANMIQAGEEIRHKMESVDVADIVSLTIEELISIHGERFIISTPKTLQLECDAHALRRIIDNLCSNAIKYGDPLKKVKVTLNFEDSSWFEIIVQNFGALIEGEDLKKIFHQFGRTDSAQRSANVGWGLGLTLVKGISRGLGGDVSVTSDLNSGTIFKVRLPIVRV
jgi:signal transduction histidine kinase